MSDFLSGFKKILDIPLTYRAFTKLVSNDKSKARYVQEYIKPRTGHRILDIGSGPCDILEMLPQVDYIGFDMNPKYIEAAKKKFGNKGTFLCKKVDRDTIIEPSSFDIIIANGVLHHLNDEEAFRLFELAKINLKPSGRLITFDGCYTNNLSMIVKLILSLDRGQFIRSREGYIELASKYFPIVKATHHQDFLRIPYSHLILECSL